MFCPGWKKVGPLSGTPLVVNSTCGPIFGPVFWPPLFCDFVFHGTDFLDLKIGSEIYFSDTRLPLRQKGRPLRQIVL